MTICNRPADYKPTIRRKTVNEMIKLYVSVNGSDAGTGSEVSPFASIQRAVDEVKKLADGGLKAPVTVYFAKGEYNTASCINMTEAVSGTAECPITYTALGDGEVVFNSGVTLKAEDFMPVEGAVKARFAEDVQDKILVCDLKAKGVTKELLGPVYSVGAHNNASRYFGDVLGKNAELFWDEKRMTLARYPNEGFAQFEAVADWGECRQFEDGSYNPKWNDKTYECRGGTLVLDDAVNERMKKWQDKTTAWCFGYFFVDWGDASSPIVKIDTDAKTITLRYASVYGYKAGANYYLYNVLEELDAPGEFYIDRENLLMYVYPPADPKESEIMLSLSRESIINGENVNYITFENITFKGSRNDALVLKGDHNAVKNCKLTDICGWAIKMYGVENTVYGCDVSRTGEGGVLLEGGDRATLTHSNNLIENNYIHDWSELSRMYNAGAAIQGCGGTVRHNEFARSPHLAITHPGNEHLIEYNYLHEVVQESNDAGAIYTGWDWAAHGTVARYNFLENVGNDKFFPVGIYWDDILSGQTAYGNIIISSAKGFLCGGGRDHSVYNNIIIGDEYSILFDDRLRDGIVNNGWFRGIGAAQGSRNRVPFKEEPWISRYPHLAEIDDECQDPENINFGPNPAYAVVKNNICVSKEDWGLHLQPAVKQFGDCRDNVAVTDRNLVIANEKFELTEWAKEQVKEFEPIPFDKIGRY